MTDMDTWKKGTLGGLCTIEIGGTPSRSQPEYWDSAKDSSNRWVSIRDLNKRVISETAEYITDSGIRNSNVKRQRAGTVLLSFKLSIGRVAFAGCDIYTNEAIAGLCSDDLVPEFLFYGLQQWDLLKNVDQAIKGATLNKEKLKQIEFKYPDSLAHQTKISSILSKLDRAIEQTEAIIAKQQRIKTGLMQDLLTKGIDENGNLRSEATHKFKDSPLGRIPVEWDVVQISTVLREKPKNGYSPKESESYTGAMMLGLGCLSRDGFTPIQLKNAPAGDQRLQSALLSDGDFLISRSNTPQLVGLVGIYSNVGTDCVYPDLMVRLRFDESVSHEFMQYVFQHHILRSQITNAAVGTSGSMVKINSQVIQSCRFLQMRPEEQRVILGMLRGMSLTSCKTHQYKDKLVAIRTGLMNDLLTGKVRATALLDQSRGH